MPKFKKDSKVKIANIGEEANVLAELENGGQGTVYCVSLRKKEYAMKWYHKPQNQDFYNNLKNNIEKGKPKRLFPLAIVSYRKSKR